MNKDLQEIIDWIAESNDKETPESLFEEAMGEHHVRKGQRKYYMQVFKTFLENVEYVRKVENDRSKKSS